MNLERYLFEGQVDEILGPDRRQGLWRGARVLLQVARFVILIPLLLPALAIFAVPTFALCLSPLLVPGLLWALGGLGTAALWPEGGAIVGAAAFALVYSAVAARWLNGYLGGGAGWRYWAIVHEEGFPE